MITLVCSTYSKSYLPLSLILTWEKTQPLLNLTLFLCIRNLYSSNWTWWENKYTNMLADLLQMFKDQLQMGPNAIFDSTTFPKPFIYPLPPPCNSEGIWSEEWSYFTTSPPSYSSLSAKEIEAIRRGFQSLPPTCLPSSGPLALTSAFPPTTIDELTKLSSSTPTPLLEPYILTLFFNTHVIG